MVAYMALVFFLSSLPAHEISRFGLSSFLWNLGHVPLFAGLSWVTLWSFEGAARTRILMAGLICLIFAALDEWHQSFVPGRTSSVSDVGMDLVGITLGMVIWEGLGPIKRFRKGGPQR